MRRYLGTALLIAVLLLCSTGARAQNAPPLPVCLRGVNGKICYGPPQMRRAYAVDPLLQRGITGRGRSIAIVVSFGSPTLRSDLRAFDRAFSLPDPQLDIRAPLGTSRASSAGWRGETTLDVEWAHAMAPDARIVVLTSPVDETEGTRGLPQFLALERYALQHHLADVISQSWAATEDTLLDPRGRALVAQFHAFYRDATRAGVTIVGASGDSGTAGLDLSLKHLYPYRVVQYPASDPLVLSVGGTRLAAGAAARSETAWPGSGGGASKIFGEPVYQRDLPLAAQGLLHGMRGLPDVALNAARESPVVIYEDGRWRGAGGTSAGAPQWAGLVALADSLAGRDLGDIHTALYRLARSPRYAADMYDITEGSIKDPPGLSGGEPALHAGPGWDPATGLGSPHAASLLPDLAGVGQTFSR